MTYMELHFAVRILIVGIALSYILAPMLWHWRAWLALVQQHVDLRHSIQYLTVTA